MSYDLATNTDSGGQRRLIRMAGVDGGIVTHQWVFRMTFAGVTNAVGCVSCFSGFFISGDVPSGTLNGSFDRSPTCLNDDPLNTAAVKVGSCSGPGLNANISLLLQGGGTAAGYIHVFARDFTSSVILFDQRLLVCDFADGVVLNNRITAAGCYTPVWPGAVQGVAVAYGGTCTITRLSC